MAVKILLTLAALLAIFLVIVALQPAGFRISRSAAIAAPPAVVFEQVNDLHKWEAWSPWAKLDPNAKSTFAGPGSGVGAAMSWEGNKDVGQGTMTITESRPVELVGLRLEFLKPFKATNNAELSFTPQANQTLVTWSMTGKNNFMFKAVSMFMDCDKMVGGDFEKGLASLKGVVEAPAKP